MVNWLYEQQLCKQLASGTDPYEGVVLKKTRGTFICCPPQMAAIPDSLYAVVSRMNVRCAMTVNTLVARALLDYIVSKTDFDYVPLPDGLRVQVIRTMPDLLRCQLHHFAAFIQDVRILVVWDDEPEKLLTRVQTLEARFVEMIWRNGEDGGEEDKDGGGGGKEGVGVGTHELDLSQLEEAPAGERRPVRLESAFMVAITLGIWIVCPAIGWRWLVFQTMVDGAFLRFALLATLPAQLFVSLVSAGIPGGRWGCEGVFADIVGGSSSSSPWSEVCARSLALSRLWPTTASTTAARRLADSTAPRGSCRTSQSRCPCTRRGSRALSS